MHNTRMNKIVFAKFILVVLASVGVGQMNYIMIDPLTQKIALLPPLNGPVRTVLTIQYRNDRIVNTVVDSYDAHGRKQESIYFGVDREVHTDKTIPEHKTIKYYHDDRTGRLVKSISGRRDSGKFAKTTFLYDSKQRLVEQTFFSETDEIQSKRFYDYRKNDTEIIISNTLFFEARLSLFEKHIFQVKNNRVIQTVSLDKNDRQTDSTVYGYDEAGNIVKETVSGKYNFSTEFSYVFDAQGNWVERDEKFAPKETSGQAYQPASLRTFRVITYY